MPPEIPLFPDLLAAPWRFLWHLPTRSAILADLHLSPIPTPHLQTAWEQLASRNPAQVILAGDVMNAPDVPASAIDNFRHMLRQLPPSCRIRLTPGNHDPHNLDQHLQIESSPFIELGAYTISHGHILPEIPRRNIWIVGHQHPAVTLKTAVQSAKMACFALCAATRVRPRLLLLPAFNRDAGGPLGANLSAFNWILPVSRPSPPAMHIFGILEPAHKPPQVLDFGTLAQIAP